MEAYIVDAKRADGSKARDYFERHTDAGAKVHFDRLWRDNPSWVYASLYRWHDTGWRLLEIK